MYDVWYNYLKIKKNFIKLNLMLLVIIYREDYSAQGHGIEKIQHAVLSIIHEAKLKESISNSEILEWWKVILFFEKVMILVAIQYYL